MFPLLLARIQALGWYILCSKSLRLFINLFTSKSYTVDYKVFLNKHYLSNDDVIP